MNQIESTIEELYADNASRLHQICHREMAGFGGISSKDYDDFYSRLNYEITLAKNHYNPKLGKTFMAYIVGVIRLAIKKEVTDRNRYKRQADRLSYSMETPVGDEGVVLGDILEADFNIDDIVLEESGDLYDEKVEEYLKQLTSTQRKILELKMNDVPVYEIRERLGLSSKQYNQNFEELKSFTKINILYRNNAKENKEDNIMSVETQTMENCKTDRISISSIIKKIDRHTIKFDHPLQRESDQWSPAMKGNLVSDILQGNKLNPLIFAEQIINGIAIIWDLDGKQRCTNAYSFAKNGYKISKNIRRGIIRYQTTQKDEEGNYVLDDNGFPITKNEECDIRGKKFSDLPEELQDRFLDYTFNYDQYLNCSEEDIGYHIERYNDGKHMTTPQKGIIKLGSEYAEMVKSISNMPFFKDMGGYKVSEFKNGTINRVVVESVMTANFIHHWKKTQEDMCKYIKENATALEFDNFEDMVERLEKVMTDEVADMFDSKDSFLWFGLFARFIEVETDDRKFIKFMAEFSKSLHSKKLGEISFDDLNGKSTKDKSVVLHKMKHLENLMYDFLKLDAGEAKAGETRAGKANAGKANAVEARAGKANAGKPKAVEPLQFIRENVTTDINKGDIELYNDILRDLTLQAGNNTELLERQNLPSLLAIVAYACEKDIDLDEWFVDFFNRNTQYMKNQRENYLYMKQDLDGYITV